MICSCVFFAHVVLGERWSPDSTMSTSESGFENRTYVGINMKGGDDSVIGPSQGDEKGFENPLYEDQKGECDNCCRLANGGCKSACII